MSDLFWHDEPLKFIVIKTLYKAKRLQSLNAEQIQKQDGHFLHTKTVILLIKICGVNVIFFVFQSKKWRKLYAFIRAV
jgi:hypothetical protein